MVKSPPQEPGVGLGGGGDEVKLSADCWTLPEGQGSELPELRSLGDPSIWRGLVRTD